MCKPHIPPETLSEIAQAIEQVMAQLQMIEQGKEIQPMRYTARLCWEQLYEPREILRAGQARGRGTSDSQLNSRLRPS
jgi:hypothetical protein